MSPLGLQLLLELLDPLLSARVRDDLGVILGLEILRILPLLVQDVEGDVAGVHVDVNQVVHEPSSFTSVTLQNSFKEAGHFLGPLIPREFNLLYDGVLLYCLENSCRTLSPNIVPFEVDLLKALI